MSALLNSVLFTSFSLFISISFSWAKWYQKQSTFSHDQTLDNFDHNDKVNFRYWYSMLLKYMVKLIYINQYSWSFLTLALELQFKLGAKSVQCNFITSHLIPTIFCRCYYSTAVMSWTKLCSKTEFPSNLNDDEKHEYNWPKNGIVSIYLQ